MTDIEINHADLAPLKSKVIVVTGGSSGIGLASVQLFLSLGAKVVVGDLNECPIAASADLTYEHVDVRDWNSQLQLFKRAIEVYGKVDCVFANAGMTSVATYMEDDVDANGDLLPPDTRTTEVNLIGCIYTCKLGIHYLKKNPDGGNVVITASASSYGSFALTDYNVSKHAVLGLMRGLSANLAAQAPNIRINALAPFWTTSGLVPEQKFKDMGIATQSADVVARSAALLMADESRRAQVIFSARGTYREIDAAVLAATRVAMGSKPHDHPQDEETRKHMNNMLMLKENENKLRRVAGQAMRQDVESVLKQ